MTRFCVFLVLIALGVAKCEIDNEISPRSVLNIMLGIIEIGVAFI